MRMVCRVCGLVWGWCAGVWLGMGLVYRVCGLVWGWYAEGVTWVVCRVCGYGGWCVDGVV